jgi:lysophospholipase L1-like esterase
VHANYGVWAVGTDFEYLLLQKILAEHAPVRVVLYVYVGNDIFEIDRPYECCAAGPLIEYRPEGPAARCPEARWRFTLASRLGHSPAPYPIRVATAWSSAARHAAAAFAVLGFWIDRPPHFISPEGAGSEEGWAHFRQLLAAMRDQLRARNVDFAVTLLPTRTALQARDPAGLPSYEAERRVAALTAELGIRTLDGWNVFAAAVKRDGAARYFLREYDIHLSAEGHRLVADWLAPELAAMPGGDACP